MGKLKQVFLIDDDPVNNFINEKTVKAHPLVQDVKIFYNGEDAITHISKHLFDEEISLIMLDVNMPRMDGFQFLTVFTKLSKEQPTLAHVPLVMLSSSVRPEDKQKSFTYEVVRDYIPKPLTLDTFDKIIKNHIYAFGSY
ncbi:MAG: response regulator [Bacteroidota bacterium]